MTTETATKRPQDEAVDEPRFAVIELGLIQESKTNPRKTFDQAGLEELAASIKEKGIIEPLIVRPVEEKDAPYELVAGARRLRAARKAKLYGVPCLVRELTDDQALEIQVIENLQRADLAPLEEARGYQELIKRGHEIEALAKKIGKSERYIYSRIELTKLSAPAQKALDDGKITPSHAQLIATLPRPEDQKQALEHCFVEAWHTGSDEAETMLVDPNHEVDVKGLVSVRDFQKTVTALNVGADLVGHLESLKSGGFKAFLVSNNWSGGRQVLSQGRWKKQGAKPCKFPAKGVVVDGKDRGKIFDICATTNCAQHFKTHPVGGRVDPAEAKAEEEKRKRAEAAAALKAELQREIKLETFRQICNKVRETPKRAIAILLAAHLGYGDIDHLTAICPQLKGRTSEGRRKILMDLKPIALAQLAIGSVCAADIEGRGWCEVKIGTFATDFGVNVKALEKGIRGKFEAKKADGKKK